MTRYNQQLQERAQALLSRTLQVSSLVQLLSEHDPNDTEMDHQYALDGIAALAQQSSDMAEALYAEVSKSTAHELARIKPLVRAAGGDATDDAASETEYDELLEDAIGTLSDIVEEFDNTMVLPRSYLETLMERKAKAA
ncbi:MAG: hypothetical protein ACSLE2_00420 [Lysobacterales bacterium]